MMLGRAALRNVLRHPWLTALAVVGVALGVAVVSAVDLANAAATRAFLLAAETVAGRATHQVVGGPAGLPEELYRTIRIDRHFRACAPVVTGHLQLVAPSGSTTFQLIGVDPFAEPPVRSFSSQFRQQGVLTPLMTRPGAVLMLRQTAAGLKIRVGDRVAAEVAGRRRELSVAGFLEPPDEVAKVGLASLLVADVATAQELFGSPGRLSRIDLVLPEGSDGERQLAELRSALPPGVTVVPAGARAGALDRMTRSFRLNLTALSLLALVVGMFLIYNTMTFSVIRRRRLIGLLRAVGVTRREIFTQVMSEALLIGTAGTVIGLGCGILLGAELTRLVTRTINDLYFVMEVRNAPLLPAALAKGCLLGVLATLAAACPAALEATSAPPRAVLSRSLIEERRRRRVPLACLGGFLLMSLGAAFFSYPAGGIVGGFAGLFAVIIGYAATIPAVLLGASRLLRPAMRRLFGVIGGMSARGVAVSLSRTGVATAAMVVAVSAGIGVSIMVGGFRLTVQHWLENWLQADVYVRSADNGGGRYRPPLDPALVERLSRLPEAGGYTLSRRVRVEGEGGPMEVFSVSVPRESFLRYPFKAGSPAAAVDSFQRGDSVLISEPYAYRNHLRPGDRVTLPTDRGRRAFPVSGIIYDYGSDTGIVIMSRSCYLQNYRDRAVDGMSFYARPQVTPARLAAALRRRGGSAAISVILNAELKSATMTVFDRTFAITGVLRMLTTVVAFVGILSALMAMQVERARELAVLRAVGLTPGQLWGVVCGETALIGVVAGLLALPLGIVEALVLVYVINLRSFGWTMQFSVAPAYLLQAVLLSVVAALLAGVYPSIAMARTSPADALKEEE